MALSVRTGLSGFRHGCAASFPARLARGSFAISEPLTGDWAPKYIAPSPHRRGCRALHFVLPNRAFHTQARALLTGGHDDQQGQ
jgi:hypothetical protein